MIKILKHASPEQRLRMFDDFFGMLLPFGGFVQRQHFFVEIPLHGFEANQAPKIHFHNLTYILFIILGLNKKY